MNIKYQNPNDQNMFRVRTLVSHLMVLGLEHSTFVLV